MSEHNEAGGVTDAFEVHGGQIELDFDGSLTELKNQWSSVSRGQRGVSRRFPVLAKLLMVVGGVGSLLCLAGDAFLMGLIEFPPMPTWVLAVSIVMWAFGLGLAPMMRAHRPKRQLDARKRGLVDALIELLAGKLGPAEHITLRVDFRSARTRGLVASSDPRFDGLGTVLPDSEPTPHDWLRLTTQVDGLELNMRVRTLVGGSGSVVRMRDEIGIELRGAGLSTVVDGDPATGLRTTLLAHQLTPERARMQFRGRGAAKCELIIEATGIPQLEALNYGAAAEYGYEGLEWLLDGSALADHVELALALVGADR